jgi:hypothetical protein
MAAILLEQRAVIDLQVLLAAETVTDITRQRDTNATTPDLTALNAACRLAGGQVRAVYGNPTDYDDTDPNIGDQFLLGTCIQIAKLYLSNDFSMTLTLEGADALQAHLNRLDDYRARKVGYRVHRGT